MDLWTQESKVLAADHGKSTLVDSIALKACMLTGRRQTRPWFGDTTDDTITIKSTAISMYFELEEEHVKTIKQPTEGKHALTRQKYQILTRVQAASF